MGDGVTPSWGLGFQLPAGRLGGVRWDRAIVDRRSFEDVEREGWTVWMDPLRIFAALR